MTMPTDTGDVAAAATTAVALVGSPRNEPQHMAAGETTDLSTEIATVLVADGNPTIRKILRHSFTALGWETIEAKDGPEAIERIRQQMPHAAVLDHKLTKINGCEVCKTLKSDEQTQMIPIIVTTDKDSPEDRVSVLEAGADDLLTKPINRLELTFRVRSLLRIHKFNKELIGAESVSLALARAVAAKDGYAQSHLEKVASHAVAFGKELGLDNTDLKILKYGAILHNVGKIAIPDSVLEKRGPLTPREKALFQHHPRVGCDICAPLKPLKPVLPIIRHHKEHWDGTGYPDGLRENEIPQGAQIVGLVDAYVAMTSDRPYRKAVPDSDARENLRRLARDGRFNPRLVDRFITYVEQTP